MLLSSKTFVIFLALIKMNFMYTFTGGQEEEQRRNKQEIEWHMKAPVSFIMHNPPDFLIFSRFSKI